MFNFKKALSLALAAIILASNISAQDYSMPCANHYEGYTQPPLCMRPGSAYEECSCMNHYFWSTVIIGTAAVAVIIVALVNNDSSHSH